MPNQTPTQVVYVLTSDGGDLYADMNLVSVWSLRHSNPGVRIVLLCDSQSAVALRRTAHPILEEVDALLSVGAPEGSPSFRNRFVKTSMRRHVDGAFLYLDGDTLIRRPLAGMAPEDAALAGVPNHNGTGSPAEIPGIETGIYSQMDWELPRRYANGGVLLFSNHPSTYAFSQLWHRKWLDSSRRSAKHFDQPSLNSAIHESGVPFAWMEHRFNAQVHVRPHTAWGAAVWHFYLSDLHVSPKAALERVIELVRAGSSGAREETQWWCEQSHPWRVDRPTDLLVVSRLMKPGRLLGENDWERLWLAGEHRAALGMLGNQLRNTCRRPIRALQERVGRQPPR